MPVQFSKVLRKLPKDKKLSIEKNYAKSLAECNDCSWFKEVIAEDEQIYSELYFLVAKVMIIQNSYQYAKAGTTFGQSLASLTRIGNQAQIIVLLNELVLTSSFTDISNALVSIARLSKVRKGRINGDALLEDLKLIQVGKARKQKVIKQTWIKDFYANVRF